MSNKNIVNDNLIANLTDEQLDELLAYTPAFSQANVANIKARSLEKISTDTKRGFSVKKLAVTLVAAVLLFAMSTAVLAYTTGFELGDIFNSFFNNPAAAHVMDVDKVVVNNGIEMTLVSAHTDGANLSAMLIVRDLEGNRFDDDFDLVINNELRLRLGYVSTPVVYDNQRGGFVMGINIAQLPHFDNINVGDYFTFSVESVLSDMACFESMYVEFPLHEYAIERDMVTYLEWMQEVGTRGQGPRRWTDARELGTMLKPGELSIHLRGIDSIEITNIGFYNGNLHIQTRRTDYWDDNSNRVHIHIDGINGVLIPTFQVISGQYQEDVFYVGEIDNLKEMRLGFWGIRAGTVTTGPWDFTFPVTAAAESITQAIQIQHSAYIGSVRMTISPMSTSINFRMLQHKERESNTTMPNVEYFYSYGEPYFTLKDGTVVELFRGRFMTVSIFSICPRYNEVTLLFNSVYFDISQIYSITIMGVVHRV